MRHRRGVSSRHIPRLVQRVLYGRRKHTPEVQTSGDSKLEGIEGQNFTNFRNTEIKSKPRSERMVSQRDAHTRNILSRTPGKPSGISRRRGRRSGRIRAPKRQKRDAHTRSTPLRTSGEPSGIRTPDTLIKSQVKGFKS